MDFNKIGIKEITEKIEVEKEILSTMPKNNSKNIKKYMGKIEELKEKSEQFQEIINKDLNKRYKNATEIAENKEIENLEKRINTIEKILYLLNDEKTSYEKMGLDRIIYKIDKFYKENLDSINEQIKEAINRFDLIGIRLELSDFNYSIYVTQYMQTFFEEEKENGIYSTKLKEKFEEVYWKCSDIIIHIELNIRKIYLKNKFKIDKYFAKKKAEILKQWGKSPNNIMEVYYDLKKQKQEKIAQDKKQILESFFNGEFNIKDFEQDKIQDNYSKLLSPIKINNIEVKQEEIEKSISEFLNTLYEYKNYIKFKFIVDDIKKYYKDKEKYKDISKESKKKIDLIEKKLKKVNKKILGKGVFNKKTKEIKQSSEQKQLTTELKTAYKELDLNIFYNKIYTNLGDDSSIYDVLVLASSNYNYLTRCIIENNKTIKQEKIDELIKQLDDFLKNPYNNIIDNLTILDEIDVAMMIKDKYKLLNFNIKIEDFNIKNIDNLIITLENIKKDFCMKKAGLKVEELKEIIQIKEVLKI